MQNLFSSIIAFIALCLFAW